MRRAPHEARTLLLDAAERLFGHASPDEIGLKDVAREAGTSHALITHYFGTYAGLVEAVLQRRLIALRERTVQQLSAAGALERPDELLAILFRTLNDPVHLRLISWTIANERLDALDAFALQQRGMEVIARQVAHALTPEPTNQLVETLELAFTTAVAAALGWAVAKRSLAGALGKKPSEELDTRIRKTLAAMLESYLGDALGKTTPG